MVGELSWFGWFGWLGLLMEKYVQVRWISPIEG